ncbi:MAG: hypothetical protein IKK64_00815 [Bacteroidales bacterium]|nr:hypothetical protein [Bacteroidales bacterium]
MKLKGNLLMMAILAILCTPMRAQQQSERDTNHLVEQNADTLSSVSKKGKEKKGEGKVILQAFANFNLQSKGGDTKLGFALDRTYLGYEYSFNNGIKIKGVVDFGKPSAIDDYNYVAYIKNAQISWTKGNFTINGGMISTTQFNMQEKFWGYRYIMKSYQDEYKFGSSADLGISASYKFTNYFTADAIIVNGEGYKKFQTNKGLLYGLGLTFTPIENLKIRLYGGFNDASESGKSDIANYAAFVGYKNDKFSLAGEFNMIQNSGNKKSANKLGCSVYGTAKVHKLINVYARYDFLISNNRWNTAEDKSMIMAGFEIVPCKYVKIAPNFRMDIPKTQGENKYMGYISCYFGL